MYGLKSKTLTSTGSVVSGPTRVVKLYLVGASSAGSVVLKNGGAAGTVIATFNFDVDGLSVYVPGSGILFEEGVYVDLTATPGVTLLYT